MRVKTYNYSYLLLFLVLFFPAGCYSHRQIATITTEKEEPYVYDFGPVKEGKILKHTFVLRNYSDKILKIKDVYSSCGCTVSKVRDKKVLAGKSTSVMMQVNTKGYSGPIKQYAYISTDDPAQQVIEFSIEALVTP